MKKKKILFAANLESFFTKFLIPQLKYFKEQDYEIHLAAKLEGIDVPYCDKKFDVDFARGLKIGQNVRSLKQMEKIFRENHYDIVSCHTPFGGAITRLAAKNVGVKDTKIVYMAHGFHFYKGAPLINWLLYYPTEKYLSKFTDTLVTINYEDYNIASKKFNSNVKHVNGVGLDITKFNFAMSKKEKHDFRKKLGLKDDDFVMIYAAELLPRKRQDWLIKTLKPLLDSNKNFKLLLAGSDSVNGKYERLTQKLGISKQVKFLGFRKDIPQLLKISNLAISSSRQEGLPVNVMEAMYTGLPVVVTDCRGNRDLIEDGANGYIVGVNDSQEFRNKIMYYYSLSESGYKKIVELDREKIQKYLLENITDDIFEIYQ